MGPKSFRVALSEFTCLALDGDGIPGPAYLLWLPVIGLATVAVVLSVYVPLALFYLPGDVAGVIALVALGGLRGLRAETEFGRLADYGFGARSRFSRGTIVAAPGVTLLSGAFLFRYAVLRLFLMPDAARLLAFGTLASFLAPLFVPKTGLRTAPYLGAVTLAAASLLCVHANRFSAGSIAFFRGPLVCFVFVYLSVRFVSRLVVITAARPNAVALPAELAGYLGFLVVRYQFI